MKALSVQELAVRVGDAVRPHGEAWGLHDQARWSYVPNPGGFVNHSFQGTDGRTRVHLKLTTPADVDSLARWFSLRERLHRRYRAPKAIAWVDLPELELAGIAFEFIEGKVAESWDPTTADQLAQVLVTLHGDEELAEALSDTGGRTLAEAFDDNYGDRFREDLKAIGRDRPPFLSRERFAWLVEESEALTATVLDDAAFAGPATQPVHGDLWLNNVLQHKGDWHLLDWDELALGDPCVDLGMLGGPIKGAMTRRVEFESIALTEGERRRVAWYWRAALLDTCIDVLADWIECENWLPDPTSFRDGHRRLHESALAAYLELYA